MADTEHAPRPRTDLTARELETLEFLAAGLSYRETAERMYVSWRTVQAHASHAYAKLGVHSRVRAINRARELGLI